MKPFAAALLSLAALPLAAPAAPMCAGTVAPLVVELYTSEGCNTCPPADRWLSGIAASRTDVIPLAFHVDYWDRLGWKDRFADAAYTRRQYELRAAAGAGFVYTPQVLLNGRDVRGLPRLPSTAPSVSLPLTLARDGETYVARFSRPAALRAVTLAAYWAVTEDAHVSDVKAGENAGVTLRHDAVVRQYQPVSLPAGESGELRFAPREAAAPGHPRHVVFVVTRADNGAVLQAASAGC